MPKLESLSLSCSPISEKSILKADYNFPKLKVLGVSFDLESSDKFLQDLFGANVIIIRT